METIDYIYRFDPKSPSGKPPPPDARAAQQRLEEGNRMFARWMASCQSGTLTPGAEPRFVLPCNSLEVGLVRKPNGAPKQAPFAVVIGCSDARVPTEMIFGQGFNNLFVIRVAGNVLGDVCMGSVDFAAAALAESVRLFVVLGHGGCGAVTGAVDAYLQPHEFAKNATPALRTILHRIFVAVRAAANALDDVWGANARHAAGYREALIETAVGLNAAQTALAVREQIGPAARRGIEVLYGVYNLFSHQVSMPSDPSAPATDATVNLAHAPTDSSELVTLGRRIAELLRPR